MLSLIVFVLCISLCVLLHEIGHFFVANLLGAKLKTINIGFSKPLAKFEVRGVELVIRILPLGGFVECNYFTQGKLAYFRDMATLLGGCVMNIIMGCLFALIGYALPSHNSTIAYVKDGVHYQQVSYNQDNYQRWHQLTNAMIITQLQDNSHVFQIGKTKQRLKDSHMLAITTNQYFSELGIYPLTPKKLIILEKSFITQCDPGLNDLLGKELFAIQGVQMHNRSQITSQLQIYDHLFLKTILCHSVFETLSLVCLFIYVSFVARGNLPTHPPSSNRWILTSSPK